jgi:acetyltransferase
MMNAISVRTAPPASERVASFNHPSYLIRLATGSDEPALMDMFSRSSREDICLRCLGAINDFPHRAASRLARCDNDREIALVAVDAESRRPGEIIGVAHIVAEPAIPNTAEFDIMVRTDMHGRGVGFELMKEIMARARERGLKTMVGYVSSQNDAMLWMASELGFDRVNIGTGVVRVSALL